MRKLTVLFLFIVAFSCKKDKLEGEFEVLQGKWKWVSAIEIKTLISNGYSSSTTVLASDFPDTYFMEFERKGKVHFIKNTGEVEALRINITGSSTDCNVLTNFCTRISLDLNSKDDKSMRIFANDDSLRINAEYSHLPLQNRTEGAYAYTYAYYFVDAN